MGHVAITSLFWSSPGALTGQGTVGGQQRWEELLCPLEGAAGRILHPAAAAGLRSAGREGGHPDPPEGVSG